MAERRGFEPPGRFYPANRLAGGCLQPLGHLSNAILAEGVGFEPTELSLSGFQDRRLQPLGHPSAPCGIRRYAFSTFFGLLPRLLPLGRESAEPPLERGPHRDGRTAASSR